MKHCSTQFHQDQAKSFKSQSRLPFSTTCFNELKLLEAEVRMAVPTASLNVPLTLHDQLSPLIRSIFPDSQIAKRYHSASTKATCILNGAMAPCLQKNLTDSMKVRLQ